VDRERNECADRRARQRRRRQQLRAPQRIERDQRVRGVTLGQDRSLWAFRDGDAYAHAYPDDLIAADPSYAYTRTDNR